MRESNLMHAWIPFLGLLAFIVLMLIAVGLILGIVKPADAPKRLGTILGIVIVLMLVFSILMCAWSGMSLWQQIALVAIGIGFLQWRRPQRRPRNYRGDKAPMSKSASIRTAHGSGYRRHQRPQLFQAQRTADPDGIHYGRYRLLYLIVPEVIQRKKNH